MSALVSVVIPTFNRAHCLPSAIASVLGQTYSNIELLVVDDGSKDNTPELMATYQDPRLRYLPQPVNRGRNAVRNVGIRAAKGEYIAFLDSDDVWLPDKLDSQVASLAQHGGDVAMHIGAALFLRENGGQVSYPLLDAYDQPVLARHLGRDLLFPFVSQTWLVRRHVLIESDGFDERIPAWEEHDLMARICPRYRVIGSKKVGSVNFHTTGSVTSRVIFKPEVARHFVDRYCAAYGEDSRNRAAALAITGWCDIRYGDFGAGRRTLARSLMAHPGQYWVWSNMLASVLGETVYRKIVKKWLSRH